MGITALFYSYSDYVHPPCKALGLSSFLPEERLRRRKHSKTLPPHKPVVPVHHYTSISAAGWFRGDSCCQPEARANSEQHRGPAVYQSASIFLFTLSL